MELRNEDQDRLHLRNVLVGQDVRLYDFINAYDCEIGNETRVGSFVEIQANVKIGSRCKISSHTFICEGVTIGSGVFIGHHVSFINDKYPAAVNADGSVKQDNDWEMLPTHIEDRVSIGSGSVIMGGITIGRGAMIGAGSVVTKSVPAGAVVRGTPARIVATPSSDSEQPGAGKK